MTCSEAQCNKSGIDELGGAYKRLDLYEPRCSCQPVTGRERSHVILDDAGDSLDGDDFFS